MSDLCDQRHPQYDVPCVFKAPHHGKHQAVAHIRTSDRFYPVHTPVQWTTPEEKK